MVKLELWAGVRSPKERAAIKELDEALTLLGTTAEVWDRAHSLGGECRAAGLTLPAADLLICATAIHWNCEVLSTDNHIKTALEKFNGTK